MQTAHKLRSVAELERQCDHILVVHDLKVGVRFTYSYLKSALQDWLNEEPDSDFALALEMAGQMSRRPHNGHGYVRLYANKIDVPLTDWAARRRGKEAQTEEYEILFTEGTKNEILKLLRREHELQLNNLIPEVERALLGLWSSTFNMEEAADIAASQACTAINLDTLSEASGHFREWVMAFLMESPIQALDKTAV